MVLSAAWLFAAAPAQAHGAMASPMSRAVECGPEGGKAAMSAACKAAAAASNGGAMAFAAWDNLRVPNVNGRDRQRIPDGQLCSGGLSQFKGLDLARADWPTTTLSAGARFTFRYRVTIPHKGSFRLYVTRDGYSPTRPLRWADLEAKPFLTVADPPVQGGAYVLKGRLPAGKTGRHLIYTIWQTTSTPDTYYSCSDVVFRGGGTSAAPATATTEPSDSPAVDQDATVADATPMAVAAAHHSSPALLILIAAGAGLIGGAVVVTVLARRPQRLD